MTVLVWFHWTDALYSKEFWPIHVCILGICKLFDSLALVHITCWCSGCLRHSYRYGGWQVWRQQKVILTSALTALVLRVSHPRRSCNSKVGHLASHRRISLAAAFWITCSLCNWCCAATQYTVFPRSKCGSMRALYNNFAVPRSKSQRVLYKTPSLVVLLSTTKSMCLSKHRCGSKIRPRYLKLSTNLIRSGSG